MSSVSEFGDVAQDVSEFGDAPATQPKMSLEKAEGLFDGPDNFEKVLDPSAMSQLQTALAGQADQKKARMRMANQVWLASAMGLPVEEIAAHYEQHKQSYSEQTLKDKNPGDDIAFYGKIGGAIQKAKGERKMFAEMNVGLFNAALAGNDFNSTYAAESSLRRSTPEWQKDREDFYRTYAQQQWDWIQSKKVDLKDSIDVVGEYLTAAKQVGARSDTNFQATEALKNRAIETLKRLSPEDAEAAMDFAASQAQKAEGPERSFGDKLAGRVTYGVDALVGNAIGAVKEAARQQADLDVKHFPNVGFFQERAKSADEARRVSQLDRKLNQRLTGTVDPMRADGWLGNGILSAAESMPYMAATLTIPGAVVNVLSNLEQTRAGFEDKGISPTNSLTMAALAAPVLSALDFVSAKMVFAGKLPGLTAYLEAPVRNLGQLAVKFGVTTTAETGEQLALQGLRMETPTAIQAVASHLSDAVPKVDWSAELKGLEHATPETLGAVLPMVVMGTAAASFRDRAYGREYLRREKVLQAVGFQGETVKEILSAETPQQAENLIKEKWPERKTTTLIQKEAIEDLNAQAIRHREEMGEVFSAQDKALFAKYPEFNSLPTRQKPIEVKLEDGSIVPASLAGFQEDPINPEVFYPCVGYFTGSGWSHGIVGYGPNKDQVITPIPTPQQWAQGIRDVPASLKPLPPEAHIEYQGRKELVMEGVGPKVDQWRITFPDDSQPITVTAGDLQKLGYAAPALPEGIAPIPETPNTTRVRIDKTDDGTFIVQDKDGRVAGSARSPETAAQIAQDVTSQAKAAPVRDPNTTALNKEEIGLVRDLYGLQELPPPERQTFEETMSEAKREGLARDAEAIAAAVIVNPRELTAKEHAAMVLRSAELQNQHEMLLRQAADEMNRGNIHRGEELREMADNTLQTLDVLTEASDLAGTEIGRALSIRRMRINRATYELSSIIQRATLAKKDRLTHEQTEGLRKLSDQIKEQEAKIATLESSLAEERQKAKEAAAQTFVSEGRSTRAKANREANVIRRAKLKDQIREMGYRVNDITSSIGQGAKVAAIVARLARTYIEDGANTLHEVAGKLKEDIPDLTDQDIFNALGGRIKSESKKIEGEAKARIRELQKQSRLWAKIYDQLNEVVAQAKEKPLDTEKTAEVRQLLSELRMQASRVVRDQKALQKITDRINAVQDIFTRTAEQELSRLAKSQSDTPQARENRENAVRDAIREQRSSPADSDQFTQKLIFLGVASDTAEALAKVMERERQIKETVAQAKEPTEAERIAAQEKALTERIKELTDQIEGGFRNIPDAKTEPKEDTANVADLRKQVRELDRLMRTQDEIHDLEEQIRTGNYTELSAPEQRIIENAQLQDALVKRRQLQREVSDRIEALKPKTIKDRIVDVATLPRTLLATADMSATLRQGLFLSVSRPVVAGKALGQSFKAFFSQNKADAIDIAIKSHPNQIERLRSGLFLSELGQVPNAREEQFVSNLAERIPGIGSIVRASERSMATTLNLIRAAAFDQFVTAHPEASLEQRKAFAAYVNVASGRGDLGRFNKATKDLNAVFFAPRYAVSRFQLLYSPFKNIHDPIVRKAIAKDFVAFIGTGLTVLTLASLAGAQVGTDPESSDFGKIILGNTRIDIWGGLQQPVRLMLQPILAGLDKAGVRQASKPIDPLDAGLRFLSYKLAPSITIPKTLLTGKDMVGQKQEVPETLVRSIAPLLAQDVFEAYESNENAAATAALGAGGFFGLGINTQQPKK